MIRIFTLLIISLISNIAHAQFTVNIEITQLPSSHLNDPIYITGNFNKWNPNEEIFRLKKLANGNLGITLSLHNIPSDRLEFKFTRGSWQQLECNAQGRLGTPRILSLNKDTSINLAIEGWRDDFPASTASPQVSLLDSARYIAAFDDHRAIWIYLPKDYHSSKKRYPVLYMHDGQQMFDEATSTGRTGPVEWGVDELLDTVKSSHIVVAINHNDDKSKRIQEYLVHPNDESTIALGKAYLYFIVDSLKPYIDKTFRTLPDRNNTSLAGSSMGGLISLYGGILHPRTFGNLGIFSPSIWYDAEHIFEALENPSLEWYAIHSQRYFFYAGSNENRKKPNGQFVQMDKDVQKFLHHFRNKTTAETIYINNPIGRHGGIYWRAIFPEFYHWLTIHH